MTTEMNDALENAWEAAKHAYQNGHITSEATLQAHLFCSLRHSVPDALSFCEPVLVLGDGQKVIPDMLVVRENSVVAVIEMKFVPHDYPHFRADIDKLARYARHQTEYELTLDPAKGSFSEQRYRFNESCLYVYAVFGFYDAVAVDTDRVEEYARSIGLTERLKVLSHKVGAKLE